MNPSQAALAATLMLTVGEAAAFRCNGWLIEPGLTGFEVGQRCGDPASVERRTEWRPQTSFQMQCQTFMEAVPLPGMSAGDGARRPPEMHYRPRSVCNPIPITITVPVEVEIWYFDDVSVPKALHFENGRLNWIEPLWGLRHG